MKHHNFLLSRSMTFMTQVNFSVFAETKFIRIHSIIISRSTEMKVAIVKKLRK
jgi:hypothetical protein